MYRYVSLKNNYFEIDFLNAYLQMTSIYAYVRKKNPAIPDQQNQME